ncbi:glycosyltransferase family 39 protein [Methanobacterium sp.]|uniref:glycosyltransferase family 39 protein n=1 Tax=Methanobacterium sp. TaxID=2164 RepID=UPI003C727676
MNSFKLQNILRKYSSHILLVALMIIVSLVTYYKIIIQMDIGPITDTCDFLSNALVFAGQNMGYSDLTRPPFFSFLTSLFFKMGYVSPTTIYVLDGALYIFGVAGLFLLLKTHFNDILSFLGSLLYATFFTVLVYVSVGFSDIASVSFTIWSFYFLVLAVKKNSKFFYLALPFAMLAFLTRYNNALIIFPILFYILINKDKIKDVKNIVIGALASLLFLIPVFIFFYEKFGNMLYPFMSFFNTSSSASAGTFEYNPNLLFYVEKFYLFIGFEGILIILMIAAGFFIYGALKFNQNPKNGKNIFNELDFKKRSTQLKLALFAILIAIFIGTFGKVHYMVSEIFFFILSYLLYSLIKSLKIKDADIHLLVFAWFMTFFIFHSIYSIKDNRYFISMAPAIAYFLIFGINEISNRLTFKIKSQDLKLPFALILILVTIGSTASFLPSIHQANHDLEVQNKEISSAGDWLANYDPEYKNKIIYSDFWSCFGWYLKTNVGMMPIYKDYKKYSLENHSITPADTKINNILIESKADYYLSNQKGLILTSYKPVKQFGSLTIYKKK